MIPIDAYLPKRFMSPIHISREEAAQTHKDVGSEMSSSIRFGTFPLEDDGLHRPISDQEKALNKGGLSKDMFKVLEVGLNFEF